MGERGRASSPANERGRSDGGRSPANERDRAGWNGKWEAGQHFRKVDERYPSFPKETRARLARSWEQTPAV